MPPDSTGGAVSAGNIGAVRIPDGVEEMPGEGEAIVGIARRTPGRPSAARNNLVSPFVLGTSDSQNRTYRVGGRPGSNPCKLFTNNYLQGYPETARVLLQGETTVGQEQKTMLTQEQKIQAFALLAITVGMAILGI